MIKTLKNLLRSKTRTLLTMSGISVGVFSVVLISAIGALGTREVSQALVTMGINSVLVQPEQQYSTITLVADDITTLTKIKGVNKAMPLMAATTETRLLSQNVDCMAWGINSDAREIISLEAKHGRLIETQDTAASAMVCVIDEDIARATYGRSNIVGKTAQILVGGAFYEFEIVGVASSGISTLQSALSNFIPSFVYIPFTTMQRLTGRTTYDKIAVLIDETSADAAVTSQIEQRLYSAKNITGGLMASNLLQQKSQLEGIMSTVTLVLSLIAGISLFVSGLTVMTTMLVSVGERTREIGIKKAIGARDSDILREFLSESLLLSLMGSAVGAVGALLVVGAACLVMGVAFALALSAVFTPIGVSVGMGVLFGAYPAVKAARMRPIDALR